MQKSQIFPILDPQTWKVIGFKERSLVHRDGDWHLGLQAYIFRQRPNKPLEVLIQKRSQSVDISGGMFDQSIAIQMTQEDKFDPIACLRRGLKHELGLDLNNLKYKSILDDICLTIVKTYDQSPSLLNRERTKLYLIHCNGNEIHPNSECVDDILWIPWSKMFAWKRSNPGLFTKTARFYTVDPIVSKEIELSVQDFVKNSNSPKKDDLPDKITYYSEKSAEKDVSIHFWKDDRKLLYVLDPKKNFTVEQILTNESAFPDILYLSSDAPQ